MILLLIILSHLIADFYLQTDKMVQNKLMYIWKHIFHHFIVILIPIFIYWWKINNFSDIIQNLFYPLSFILITHGVIDYIKIKWIDPLWAKNHSENVIRLSVFIIDQLLHLITIIISCHLFFNLKFSFIIERTKGLFLNTNESSTIGISNSILIFIIILILGTNVSGHIIRILLGNLPNHLGTFEGKFSFKNERKEDFSNNKHSFDVNLVEEYNYMIINKHDLSRGKIIGYIERLLVIILTFYGAYPAIAFIVTAKSITRFKQMDDRDWAEYFLLGTLTSMLLGLTFGLLLRQILK